MYRTDSPEDIRSLLSDVLYRPFISFVDASDAAGHPTLETAWGLTGS